MMQIIFRKCHPIISRNHFASRNNYISSIHCIIPRSITGRFDTNLNIKNDFNYRIHRSLSEANKGDEKHDKTKEKITQNNNKFSLLTSIGLGYYTICLFFLLVYNFFSY